MTCNDAGRCGMSTWSYEPGNTATLPQDLTSLHPCQFGHTYCAAEIEDDGGLWSCTRITGHTGRHAAGDGDKILAVWS